jgi:hypothetical protein
MMKRPASHERREQRNRQQHRRQDASARRPASEWANVAGRNNLHLRDLQDKENESELNA